jgi:uncharacterized protein DUF3307
LAWAEVFVVFAVCHAVGDFLFQTDWQALYKHGGLSKGGEHLRALTTHVVVYTLAFVPAFIWIGSEIGAGWAVVTAAGIFAPHFIQDDGWVVSTWMRKVKHTEPNLHPALAIAVDQSMHAVVLLLTAFLVAS